MSSQRMKSKKINLHDRHTKIMGILNVTPDSFSDGGRYVTENSVLSHVSGMIDDGADIIDIGGESTRPFSSPVTEAEELKRVIPAIKAIRQHYSIPISIDTTKAEVAKQSILAGADIINDISALRFDPNMVCVVREHKVPLIIMHMQGTPKNMQQSPEYEDIIQETLDFFSERLTYLETNQIPLSQVIIDPGIGFGKELSHNLSILKHIARYKSLGCSILVGHSRKSFIGNVLENDVDDRDMATAAISAYLAMQEASIIRVHNVAMNSKAIKLAEAITAAA